MSRRTVPAWLRQEKPDRETIPKLEDLPVTVPTSDASPPAPWMSGDEVRSVREGLRADRFLLVRRPEHLDADEEGRIDDLVASPNGADLRVAREFLIDWYAIRRDETGERRSAWGAQARYETW